jgi:hypothetical protein
MRGETPYGDEGDHGSTEPSGPSGRTLLIAAVVMVAVVYFLSVQLRQMGRLQDCAMSGRTNCAPVAEPSK